MERLSKNFIWMAAANIVSSLFNILLFIYLARILMPAALGYFAYASTFVFFLGNFIDLGLSTFGIRAIAKDKGRVSEYVSEIVSFRLVICMALIALSIVAIAISAHSFILKILLFESLLMLLAVALATEWAFQGLEEMGMVFASLTCTTFLQFSMICIFVQGPSNLLRIPLVYFLATIPVIAIFLKRLRFRFIVNSTNLKKIMAYLSSSLVIWSIALFAQIYNSLDIYILGLFRGITEVGFFSVARRIVAGFVGLMIFMANAALPRLSSAFTTDSDQFRAATKKFFHMAILITFFILLPVIIFSRQFIIMTVGKEYVTVSVPLKIMVSGLVFILFNMPYSTGLIASGYEREVLKQAAASAIISIFSNIFLIPLYGMIGAAIAFFLAEAMALMLILWIYHKHIGLKYIH